jgi:glycosyl transferase family 2
MAADVQRVMMNPPDGDAALRLGRGRKEVHPKWRDRGRKLDDLGPKWTNRLPPRGGDHRFAKPLANAFRKTDELAAIRGWAMDLASALFAGLGLVMREVALFAGAGFLLLGLGDLLVDLIWIVWALSRLGRPAPTVAALPPPERPGLIVVFVPAWDEAAVIADMLRGALAAFGTADWRLYVGCYPNDPATVGAVRAATPDARVRLVVGRVPGPTTKADCLNRLWEALLADEAADGRRAKAVVLHDAEDVVHPAELAVFDRLIETHDFVQLPVLPLIDPGSRWVGGHYADEFAEAHGKELVVRQALGAALPSAGVGCAFSRDALARIAAKAGGLPFDAASLTEDYELGLKVREEGGRAVFVRIAAAAGRPLVATREYFPGTLTASVAQKARWMTGIALAGWDRLGWSGGVAERWMRLRDRQSLLAALFMFAGYLAALLWLMVKAWEGYSGLAPAPLSATLSLLLTVNAGLLAWRVAMRFGFVARAYGWREGLRSIARTPVANVVTMLAATQALGRYRAIRRTGRLRWDKTAHVYPAAVPAE